MLEQLVASATDWHPPARSTPAERLWLTIAETVALWRGHAPLVLAMSDAAAADPAAQAMRDEWIESWGRRAAARIEAERQIGTARDGIDAGRLAWMLADMTVHAMERDVREIMDGGRGIPALAEALAAIWVRAIYGRYAGDNAREVRANLVQAPRGRASGTFHAARRARRRAWLP